MSTVIDRGNFVAHFERFMDHLIVGVRPMGLDTSVTPPLVSYDPDGSVIGDVAHQKMRSLVNVPHISEQSWIANRLLDSEPSDFSAALTRVQQVANEVTRWIESWRSDKGSLAEMANGHIRVVERDAEAAGVKLSHVFKRGEGWYIPIPGVPGLPAEAQNFNDETWQRYFRAAIFRSASGERKETFRAIAEFMWASQAVGSKVERALILELGAALLHNVDDGRVEHCAYEKAIHSWKGLLDDETYRDERSVVIAQGVENALAGKLYRKAESFWRSSLEDNVERPSFVLRDHVRLAWLVVESEVKPGADRDVDWNKIEQRLGEALVAAREGGTASDFIQELEALRAAASTIATEMG